MFNLLTKTNSYAINRKNLTHHRQRNPIRLVNPASIFALALSIFSFPIISKADLGGYGTSRFPLNVKITNTYQIGGL